MATPSSNSVGVTVIDPARTGLGKYLADGEKWGGALGTGVTLTYSFGNTSSVFVFDYGTEPDGIIDLTAGEKALARSALAAWSAVANIKFAEVSDTSSTVGEIRISKSSSVPSDEYAHAYMPSNDTSAGDVWLQSDNFNPSGLSAPQPGSDDFQTLIHELGHSLGLKHSFEGPNALQASMDNFFYSVMSYSARVKGDSGLASFMPTTPMYYDLLAIQALYGRNMSHNAGDTVYTFNQGQKYFQTIDDAGGASDTIVFQGTKTCTIDLNPGAFSSLSEAISFDNGTTRATVCIGPNSIIENATGGGGNDVLTGNSVANKLTGGNGGDALRGGGGNDYLFGGAGNDTLTGGTGADRFIFNTALSSTANKDTITDFSGMADDIYLARSVFTKLAAGGLASGNFWTGTAAHDANDFIVYDKARGNIFYDSNGSGAGGAILIASITANTALSSGEIIVF